MSINLPGYGTAGWGATLNNYLRNLEKRLNVIEGKVNSNSTVEEQILAVSRYAGSGLTSTSTTIKHKDSSDAEADVTETYALSDLGGKLIFKNLSYYIAASLTNSGGSHITFDTDKEWVYDSSSLGSTNQSLLLVIDQYGVFSLLPHVVNGNPTNTSATNLNFCRLGYITRINTSVFFTPAPEIASISTSSKFDFWSSPKIKTQRQNSNSEAVGDFAFSAEGLGYCQNASSVNNILINDFDILNTLTYKGVGKYYTITGTNLSGESDFATTSVDGLNFNDSSNENNGLIRVYYVTLIGKVFCCTYSVKKDEMPITSQELGSYQLNRQDDGAKLLFENYRYICPVEVFRLAKNKYGTIISYSNTYNGFPPQLHNTPIFGSNNAVNWNQFHFMQNSEATGSNSSQHDTLSIRPIVNTDPNKVVNSFVTIDMTNSTDAINNEVLLMKHPYNKNINLIGASFSYQLNESGTQRDVYAISRGGSGVISVIVEGLANKAYGTGTLVARVSGTTTPLGSGDGYYHFTGTTEYQGTEDITLDNLMIPEPHLITSYNPESKVISYDLRSERLNEEIVTTITMASYYGYDGILSLSEKPESCSITGTEKGNTCSSYSGGISYSLKGGTKLNEKLSATITYSFEKIAHDFKGNMVYLSKLASNNAYLTWTGQSLLVNSDKNIDIVAQDIVLDGNILCKGLTATLGDMSIEGSLTVNNKTIIKKDLEVEGTVTWTSDRNLKTNITPMVFNSTEFVNSIPLYNYALKSAPNNQTIGLMAQDLQEHLPQLVHEAQDGHLTIEETKLVYICMDALKQANQRIELLEGKVNDLCNKISQYRL